MPSPTRFVQDFRIGRSRRFRFGAYQSLWMSIVHLEAQKRLEVPAHWWSKTDSAETARKHQQEQKCQSNYQWDRNWSSFCELGINKDDIQESIRTSKEREEEIEEN